MKRRSEKKRTIKKSFIIVSFTTSPRKNEHGRERGRGWEGLCINFPYAKSREKKMFSEKMQCEKKQANGKKLDFLAAVH